MDEPITEGRKFAAELVGLEQQLHSAGFHEAARKVNDAVNAVGWEMHRRLTRKNEHQPEATPDD